jgi:hypothetical protein
MKPEGEDWAMGMGEPLVSSHGIAASFAKLGAKLTIRRRMTTERSLEKASYLVGVKQKKEDRGKGDEKKREGGINSRSRRLSCAI